MRHLRWLHVTRAPRLPLGQHAVPSCEGPIWPRARKITRETQRQAGGGYTLRAQPLARGDCTSWAARRAGWRRERKLHLHPPRGGVGRATRALAPRKEKASTHLQPRPGSGVARPGVAPRKLHRHPHRGAETARRPGAAGGGNYTTARPHTSGLAARKKAREGHAEGPCTGKEKFLAGTILARARKTPGVEKKNC